MDKIKKINLEIEVLKKRVLELEKIENRRKRNKIISFLIKFIIIIVIIFAGYYYHQKIVDMLENLKLF